MTERIPVARLRSDYELVNGRLRARSSTRAGAPTQRQPEALAPSAPALVEDRGKAALPNKYRAVRTEGPSPLGPRTYDSKAEAGMARTLEDERHSGGCVSWVPQVSVPCGVDAKGRDARYRADALVILEVRPDGSFVGRLLDRKGVDTPASKAKRAAVKALYGLEVEILR
jgi:hypothetical protein